MTNNEFYYLVLVIAAFGTFGVSLAIAHHQYKKWRDRQAAVPAPPETIELRRAA